MISTILKKTRESFDITAPRRKAVCIDCVNNKEVRFRHGVVNLRLRPTDEGSEFYGVGEWHSVTKVGTLHNWVACK